MIRAFLNLLLICALSASPTANTRSAWDPNGPFEMDHWPDVFGNAVPLSNRNGGAGIDLSPTVRDFLHLSSGASVEWRFAEDREVPPGPWQPTPRTVPFARGIQTDANRPPSNPKAPP